jgi:hypothetical protein
MADVKALFPIGKTQWSKWSDDQRTAFNEARAEGVEYADAVAGANQTQTKKKKNVFDIIGDVAETAVRVGEVAASVSPALAVAKTLVKKVK